MIKISITANTTGKGRNYYVISTMSDKIIGINYCDNDVGHFPVEEYWEDKNLNMLENVNYLSHVIENLHISKSDRDKILAPIISKDTLLMAKIKAKTLLDVSLPIDHTDVIHSENETLREEVKILKQKIKEYEALDYFVEVEEETKSDPILYANPLLKDVLKERSFGNIIKKLDNGKFGTSTWRNDI